MTSHMKYYFYIFFCASMSLCKKNYIIETKETENGMTAADLEDAIPPRRGRPVDFASRKVWKKPGRHNDTAWRPQDDWPMDCEGLPFFLQAHPDGKYKFVKGTCKVRMPSGGDAERLRKKCKRCGPKSLVKWYNVTSGLDEDGLTCVGKLCEVRYSFHH